MKKNNFLLDKYSLLKNNPLFISMQICLEIKNEIDVDTLIRRVLRKRKNTNNVVDEARIINSIGMLYSIGKIKYYKGYIEKCF